MAFCNSCGTALEAGAKFCKKCGAAAPEATASVPVAQAAPPAAGGSGALKVILIVVAIVVALGILGVGALTFTVWRVAKHSRVENRNGKVHVETPLGSIDTSADPADVARNIGVDIYPGATVRKGGAANVNFGTVHTTAAALETDDSPDKVFEFYKARYPGANVVSAENGQYNIVSGEKDNVTTINIQTQDGKTVIQISKMTKSAATTS